MLDGVRSAEPHSSSGNASAHAANTFPDELRVASALSPTDQRGSLAAQSAGSAPLRRRLSSACSAGYLAAYASKSLPHAAWLAAPAAPRAA